MPLCLVFDLHYSDEVDMDCAFTHLKGGAPALHPTPYPLSLTAS